MERDTRSRPRWQPPNADAPCRKCGAPEVPGSGWGLCADHSAPETPSPPCGFCDHCDACVEGYSEPPVWTPPTGGTL